MVQTKSTIKCATTSHSHGYFPAYLPILNGRNHDNWWKKMKVVFGYQVVWNLVNNGVDPISDSSTNI